MQERPNLARALADIRRRRRRLSRAAEIARIGWAWGGFTLATLLADAVWPLPPIVRVALAGSIVAGLFIAVWRSMRPTTHHRLHDAQAIEHRNAMVGNPLINAASLYHVGAHNARSLSSVLRARSADRGAALLTDLDITPRPQMIGLVRQLIALAAIAAVGLCIALVQPRLLAAEWARFTTPLGDHPPFSTTRITLAIDPTEPMLGADVTVYADLSSNTPHPLELVELDDDHQPTRRWPMRRDSTGRFHRRLLGLDQPITVHVESGATRSRRHRIAPAPLRQEARRDQTSDPAAINTSARLISRSGQSTDAAHLANLAEAHLQALADTASAIRKLADTLADNGSALNDDQLAGVLGQAAELLAEFTRRRDALTASLGADRTGRQGSSAAAEPENDLLLAQTHETLARLELPRLSRHRGQAKSATANEFAADWFGTVRPAVDHDLDLLREQLQRLRAAGANRIGARRIDAQESDEAPGDQPSTRLAVVSDSSAAARPSQAAMAGVPLRYREAVGRYFQTLASDKPLYNLPVDSTADSDTTLRSTDP